MSKRAPSTTQLLVIAGFALSCFGILLFLWITFGGPTPVQGEAVRDRDPLQRGDPARPAVRRADLRRLGRQGAGHRPRSQRQTGPGQGRRSTTSTRRSRGEPGRSCAPRPCSARPTSNSPPATATARCSPTAAPCPRRTSPNRCSSTRSSAPSTPRPAPPSSPGSRKPRWRSPAAAPTSPTPSAQLEPSFTQFDRIFRVLDSQRLAVSQPLPQRRHLAGGPARPPR